MLNKSQPTERSILPKAVKQAPVTVGPHRVVLAVGLAIAFLGLAVTSCRSTSSQADHRLHRRPALSHPMSFAELLRAYSQMAPEELRTQLEAIHASESTSVQVREEAAYCLGRVLAQSSLPDDQKQALQCFEEAKELRPLWERCQWHISECAAQLGREKTVRAALEEIKSTDGNSGAQAQAEYGLAQSYLRGNEKDRALESFAYVHKHFPKSQFALGAAYYLGESFLDTPGQYRQGLDLFRRYLKESPDGHFASTICARLSALKEFSPTPADLALFAGVHYASGEWQEALSQWKQAGDRRHWFEQAICLSKLKRATEAQDALIAGIKQFPLDRNLPAAARLLSGMLNQAQAIALWKGILSDSSLYGDLALWNLAVRAPHVQSIAYYQQLIARFPHSEFAAPAFWWITWDAERQGKTRVALSNLKMGLKRYPKSRQAPQFSFWRARLEERLSLRSLARADYLETISRYPAHYYGWRARFRLAALSGGRDRGWSTNPTRRHPDPNWSWPSPPQLISYEQIGQACGATVALLARLNQWDECLSILPVKVSPTLKAWLLSKVNLPLDAIASASGGMSGTPAHSGRWMISYPLLYGGQVAQNARSLAVDPLLIHALIREESRYNPLATSRSNAIGLMQLLPTTAYGVARDIGLSLSGVQDIYKPDNNIKLGSEYLAHTIGRFQGNALLAVAGYNGGPAAVQQWVNQLGVRDVDSFVESIPYKESRDYVRKVFGSYWNYEKIYPGHR